MARIRTIKPEFWKHEDLSTLPEAVHMLAAALLNYADDEGFFNANPSLIQAECFPLRALSVSIQEGLSELSNIDYLRLGSDPRGRRYGKITNFDSHQKVNRPSPSKINGLEIVWEGSGITHGLFSEPSLPEGKGKEQGTGNKEQGKEVVRADARSSDYAFDGKVVKLTHKDFDRWEAAYANLDLRAELEARDAWLASDASNDDRKRWFVSTSKYLANRNMEARSKNQTGQVETFGGLQINEVP